MSSIFKRIQQNKHFKYGIPFFAFIFGGKLFLEELRSVRYDPVLNPRGNKKLIKPEELFAELEQKTTGKFSYKQNKETAEEQLENLDKKIDWDNWENKRGPRPWEEGSIEKRPIRRIKKEPVTVKELLGE